jgi:PAS domain-containing protein
MVNIERVGVLTFDIASGTLVDANDAFLQITGIPGKTLPTANSNGKR